LVSLIIFQGVSKDKNCSGPYANYQLARSLYVNNLLNKVICLYYDKDLDIPGDHFISILSIKRLKLIFKLLDIIRDLYPSFNPRHHKEILFDLYASRCIDKERDRLIFCIKPPFPITIKKAKKIGIKTCIQTDVAHPLFNFSLVKNEEVKQNLKTQTPYTNLKRALRLSSALNETDKLLIPGFGKRGFLLQSYADFIPSNKIISINSYFPLDKTFLNSSKVPNNKKDSITFLHLSYMNLIKGMPYLLSAWDLLMRKYNIKGRLVLVGNMDRNVERLYKRYGNTPNIEFRGFVKDLRTAYEAGDVFVSPSVSDAGPTTILEAMAMGLAVISSTNCGFSSLIEDGRNGFTYQFNDIERLSDIMYWCSQNPDKVAQMGVNARKDIERFSLQNYTEEIIEKIKEIL